MNRTPAAPARRAGPGRHARAGAQADPAPHQGDAA
jgi:hypothetical protein